MGNPTPFDVDDIWAHCESSVDKSSGCWLWTRYRNDDGYGQVTIGADTYLVHRIAFQSLVGDIPEDRELDHLCRNPPCCNPEHLEVVTTRTNILRGISIPAQRARQTHCIHGHAFDAANTDTRSGRRECIACAKRRRREYKERQKALLT